MSRSAQRETFGERLRRLRAAAGMSQSQLATASEIPKRCIEDWEQGQRSPRIERMGDLARALGVDVSSLIG